ncbi:hypothetical protein [Burkholderia lata]|uniref:restriction endonuclease-related protein n=1 Tax=Burkholderia lata (strain ATCC 17760 / DSM 23089 / LMG 22485 / NCIMB 9086 / R18194 / 383) TaxID=482957 RepID=UPI00158148AD|nr:hypothetical protein [Burkholderia lata]
MGIIAPALRKRYQWRHLVQLVVACVFVQLGQSRKSVAKRMQSLAPNELVALLEQATFDDAASPAPGTPSMAVDESRALELAHDAIPLLAAGLVDHFRRARAGQPLVHDAAMSPWLRSAMLRLASLYVLYGRPVQADGAHTLVVNSTRPLREREWDLPVFDTPEFRFHGIRLLDTGTRLPTIECIDLASQTASELDLKEQQAFAQLESTCDLFGSRGDEVYSALREFIARHPITSAAEQRRFLEAGAFQLATPFLASCYEQIQPHHLVKGSLFRCATCGAPLIESTVDSHLSCAVRQCKAFESPVPRELARAVTPQEALVVKAHILVYWCGPGQDEIALYDTATSDPPGLDAALYPGRDRCDLSLDAGTTGIDIKSHANPFVLANALNRGLGGLELYTKKVIAINDQSLSRFPDYLEILRRECNRRDVEYTSVSALRRDLRARA